MKSRTLLLTFTGVAHLLLAGCATPVTQPALSPDHPANPAAAETPLPEPSQTLALNNVVLAQPPDQNSTAAMKPATAAGTYTCPMHKEVVSSQPGKCPKCGMKLMPKASVTQPTPGKAADHVHDHGGQK